MEFSDENHNPGSAPCRGDLRHCFNVGHGPCFVFRLMRYFFRAPPHYGGDIPKLLFVWNFSVPDLDISSDSISG